MTPFFLVGAGLLLSFGAFSRESRQIIMRRDKDCVMPPPHEGGLEAAHINHKKDNNYDNPNNGRVLCTKHHLEDHISRAGRNGLSKNHNNWAINMLLQRLGSK